VTTGSCPLFGRLGIDRALHGVDEALVGLGRGNEVA